MKQTFYLLAAMLALAIAVTGCDKLNTNSGDDASGAANSATEIFNNNASNEKLDAYLEGYNSLISGPWGFYKQYEKVERFTSRAKTSDSSLSLPTVSGLNRAIDSFNKGLAISKGGMEDLDEAVKAVLEPAQKIKAMQGELEPYFKSRAYKDDNLAKGKAAFPEILANYESFAKNLDQLGNLIHKYQRQRAEKSLEAYKKSGDMMLYHTEESMLLAQDLLNVFDDPEAALKSQETFTKGNEILTQLEASLEAHRKVIEEYKSKGEKYSAYESVNKALTGFIGSYRNLREKKTDKNYNKMVDEYNRAVDSYNRAGRRPY